MNKINYLFVNIKLTVNYERSHLNYNLLINKTNSGLIT
jgi:hypothetical protein